MNKNKKRKWFLKTMRALNQCVLLVEGKRDERALKKTGVTARVFVVAGQKPQRIAEKVLKALPPRKRGRSRLVLLLDFDEEGKRKAREFSELFLAEGVAPNAFLRKQFKQLFGVTTLEDLPFCYSRLLEELE